MWKYETKQEWQYHPDLGWYLTYLLQAERRVSNEWKQTEIIHDVTTKHILAEKLAVLCTEYQLSPIHLRDVVKDLAL